MKERLTSRKIAHLTMVLAILLSLMAYRTWFSGPQSENSGGTNDQICDLSHSPCPLRVGDATLTASIDGLPIRPEHDFVLRLQGSRVQSIAPKVAWLEGKEMFMGRIPVQFEAASGGWQARAQVGACTSATMTWLLNLEWNSGQRQQLALSVSR
ncbi:hypothetical protein J9885_08370 [Aeromonas sp. SrichE-2G]|uniref:hypothetical protein n=1 Tax=Aeromonas sp. SrichE-2G TaxID=2823359 RepID=UPI001B3434E2|nr:hypothetical protein [Aeromonas sp. SrichE-2G]MBP4041276.1 hypothetical protein [Aeromonas sp. SrichE-2G]